MITQQAMKAGFTGGLVVDYPNSTRAKKYAHAPFRTAELDLRLFFSSTECFCVCLPVVKFNSYLKVSAARRALKKIELKPDSTSNGNAQAANTTHHTALCSIGNAIEAFAVNP